MVILLLFQYIFVYTIGTQSYITKACFVWKVIPSIKISICFYFTINIQNKCQSCSLV